MNIMKRNDGYALSYVLVILLVLSVIAISTLSAPLRNLQTQQTSIERMQEKYLAQGKIEQMIAEIENTEPDNLANVSSKYTSYEQNCTPPTIATGQITSKLYAKIGKTEITATVIIEPVEKGHITSYHSYKVEVDAR